MDQQHQIPVAYPPQPSNSVQMQPPPPVGYPSSAAATYSYRDAQPSADKVYPTTQSRGDGFWKGCCAALCCCCVLDACF